MAKTANLNSKVALSNYYSALNYISFGSILQSQVSRYSNLSKLVRSARDQIRSIVKKV